MQKLPHNAKTVFDQLGHEIVGTTLVDGEMKFVVVNPLLSCGICRFCKQNQEMFCTKLHAYGRDQPGGFGGGYLQVPESNIAFLPEHMPPALGVLVDPYAVVLHGVKRLEAEVAHYTTIVIEGDGIVAALFLLHCKLSMPEVNVTLVCRNEARKAAYKQWYHSHFHDKRVNFVTETTMTYDVAVEAVGRDQNVTINQAIDHVGPHGGVVGFGVYPPNSLIGVNLRMIMYKELSIIGVNSYTPDDFTQAIAMIARHCALFMELLGTEYDALHWQDALNHARCKTNLTAKRHLIRFS